MFVIYLGAKLIETIFYTAEITWRAGSSVYGWYYPTLSDTEKMQIELKGMKSEFKEIIETNKELIDELNELKELKELKRKNDDKNFVLI